MITAPLGAITNGAILMRIGVASLEIMTATAVEFVVCVKGGLVFFTVKHWATGGFLVRHFCSPSFWWQMIDVLSRP